jgi:hypothetical protein
MEKNKSPEKHKTGGKNMVVLSPVAAENVWLATYFTTRVFKISVLKV